MINIWEFVNAKKVKITDIDGKEFVGDIVAMFDKEETYDDEVCIDLSVNDGIIGFMQSEIKNIEVLKWKEIRQPR